MMKKITLEVANKVLELLGTDEWDYMECHGSNGFSRLIKGHRPDGPGGLKNEYWHAQSDGDVLMAILNKVAESGKHLKMLASITAQTHGISKDWKPDFLSAAINELMEHGVYG